MLIFSIFIGLCNHLLPFLKNGCFLFPLPPQFALYQLKAVILYGVQLIILSSLRFIPLVILLSLSDLHAMCSYIIGKLVDLLIPGIVAWFCVYCTSGGRDGSWKTFKDIWFILNKWIDEIVVQLGFVYFWGIVEIYYNS